MTRYISLAEYFCLAEQVTGLEAAVLIKAARADLADSARLAVVTGPPQPDSDQGMCRPEILR